MFLAAIQSQFQNYLLSGVLPEQPFCPKRLKIYYDAYRIRLLEILTHDFPKTHTLLGNEHFEKAFFSYLEKYPSHYFSVRYFGNNFSDFLAKTSPFKDYPAFSEMAMFEWAIHHTIDAPDALIVKKETFSTLPPEKWADLTIAFHPAVISHTFVWDVPQLWQDIEAKKDPRPPKLQATPTRWLFWRKGIRSFFQSCSPIEEKIFLSLQAGDFFAKTCETLLDVLSKEEIPPIAAQVLFKWVKEEMITHQ